MRTTIDLPDDVHQVALAVARDRGVTLSAAVTELLRQALGTGGGVRIDRSSRSGLPLVRVGRTVTSEDVRSLEDDD